MSAIACTITEPPFFRRLTETQFGPIGALLGSFFITFLIKSQSMKMSSKFRPPSHCSANKLSQKSSSLMYFLGTENTLLYWAGSSWEISFSLLVYLYSCSSKDQNQIICWFFHYIFVKQRWVTFNLIDDFFLLIHPEDSLLWFSSEFMLLLTFIFIFLSWFLFLSLTLSPCSILGPFWFWLWLLGTVPFKWYSRLHFSSGFMFGQDLFCFETWHNFECKHNFSLCDKNPATFWSINWYFSILSWAFLPAYPCLYCSLKY